MREITYDLQFSEMAIVNNMSKEENYNASDLYATVDKNKSKKFKSHEVSKDAFPLYSVVNKKSATKGKILEENRDSADLYATVGKDRKNNDFQTTGQDNINEKGIISPIKVTIQTKCNNYKVDCTNSFIKSPAAKPTFIRMIWSIAAAIMVLLIVAFVVTTFIGFTKVSNQPSQCSSTELNQNLAPTTPSTVVMDNSIILSNYSHLQDLFDANDILLQFSIIAIVEEILPEANVLTQL